MYAAHTQYAFQELYLINKHVKFLLSMFKSCTLYLNTVIISLSLPLTIMCVQRTCMCVCFTLCSYVILNYVSVYVLVCETYVHVCLDARTALMRAYSMNNLTLC